MKIIELVNRYLKSLAVHGRAKLTIRSAKYGLRDFNRFLEAEKIFDIEDLTGEIMAEYQQELAFRLTSKGTALGLRSQSQMLAVTKNFTRFLKEADYLIHDPGDKITLPKKPRPLPKVILSMPELKQVMKGPDSQTNQGYRNLVILEVLYDTGIRRAEVANLQLRDLDLDGGYIHMIPASDEPRLPTSSCGIWILTAVISISVPARAIRTGLCRCPAGSRTWSGAISKRCGLPLFMAMTRAI